MSSVYILTKRGTLHRTKDDGRSFEGDNLDDAEVRVIENEMEARRAADRLCRRCFPGDRLRK